MEQVEKALSMLVSAVLTFPRTRSIGYGLCKVDIMAPHLRVHTPFSGAFVTDRVPYSHRKYTLFTESR